MKKILALFMSILMLTTLANFSSLVNAITTIELAATDNISEETSDETVSQQFVESETVPDEKKLLENAKAESIKTTYITEVVTIGTIDNSSSSSGAITTQCGLKITPGTSYSDSDPDTVDRYTISGAVAKGYHLTIRLAGHIQLNGTYSTNATTGQSTIVVNSGAKLTLENAYDKDNNGIVDGDVYLFRGDITYAYVNNLNDPFNVITVMDGAALKVTGCAEGDVVLDGRNPTEVKGVNLDNIEFETYYGTRARLIYARGSSASPTTESSIIFNYAKIQNHSSFLKGTTGGLESRGSGILIHGTRDFVSFENTKFYNLKGTFNDSMSGAAIKFGNTFNSKCVLINDCTFKDCLTEKEGETNSGGAVCFGAGSKAENIAITGSGEGSRTTFQNCHSGYDAGALYIGSDVSENVIIKYCDFASCDSTQDGGSVYFSADYNVTGNTWMIGNMFYESYASVNGGAIAVNGSVFGDDITDVFSINNNLFKNCCAVMRGGALHFDEASAINAPLVINYNNEFYNIFDGVTYEGAFDFCTTPLQNEWSGLAATEITHGGAINVDSKNMNEFNILIEPSFNSPVFYNCQSSCGGAISLSKLTNGDTSSCSKINSFVIDYGTVGAEETDTYSAEGREPVFKDCFGKARAGAIYSDTIITTKMKLDDVIIDGCKSSNGSAVLFTGETVVKQFDLRDSVVRNCCAQQYIDKMDSYGATIRTFGKANVNFNILNCGILNNTSYEYGGGVMWNTSGFSDNQAIAGVAVDTDMTIENSVFNGNYAGYVGGAIVNQAHMNIKNTTIINNSAYIMGGGIYQSIYGNSSVAVYSDCELEIGEGVVIDNNFAGTFGGGIALTTNYSVNVHASDLGAEKCNVSFTMKSYDDNGEPLTEENMPRITNNTAGVNGGGLYFGMGYGTFDEPYYNTSLTNPTNGTLSSLKNTPASNTEKQKLINGYTKIININSGIISGNNAGYDGGGIYAKGIGINVSVNNGKIIGNTAGVKNTTHQVLGSKTYGVTKTIADLGDLRTGLTDEIFTQNIKLDDTIIGYGGGICIKGTDTTLDVNGGTIGCENTDIIDVNEPSDAQIYENGNKADFGGAIAVQDGKINISPVTDAGSIEFNYAKAGAGIYTIGSGTVNVYNGNISDNLSDKSATLLVNSPNADDCITVTEDAGSLMEIITYEREEAIVSDVVTGSGGAIYANEGVVVISDGAIHNNTALNGAGGGIYADNGGDILMCGGLIYGNKAKLTEATNTTTAYHSAELRGVGGAIALGAGVNSNNTTFALEEDSKVRMAIYNNTADFAANDIYASGQYTDLEMYNFTQMNNPEATDDLFTVALFEDYHSGDTSYINLKDNIGRASSVDSIARYYDGKQKYRVNDVNVGATVNSTTKQAVNTINTYVCLTVANMTDYVLGDVDGNGLINILDVSMIQLSLIRKIKLDNIQKYLGDVNGSGSITILDISIIQLRLIRKDISSVKNADGFTVGDKITMGNGQVILPESTVESSSTESVETESSELPTEESESSSAVTEPTEESSATEETEPSETESETTEPTEEIQPVTATEKSTTSDQGSKPDVTIRSDSVLAYTLKGMEIVRAVQNFCIADDYIYTTQRIGSTTYLSRLEKDEANKTATFMDMMTIENGGHGQALDVYKYNGKEYLYMAVKPETYSSAKYYFSLQAARITYEPNAVVDYTELNRFTYMNYANPTGTKLGTTYRVAVGGNDEYTIFRIQTEEGSVTYSIYDTVAINKLLDSALEDGSLMVKMNSAEAKSACVKSFTQSGKTIVRPNASFQGVDMIGMDKIYITGGADGDTPMMACMDNTGHYNKLIKMSGIGTPEIEGVQCLNNRLYFVVIPDINNKANGQQIRYIPQSYGD